jgi:hypothetical protein
MTIYTVHLPPGESNGGTAAEMERARFIPERPSLFALVIPALWLLWHRLWYALAVYLLIGGIASLLARWTDSLAIGLLACLPALYLFLEGRQLLRGRLERQGWRFVGVVEAYSANEADLRYFADTSEAVTEAMPAAPAWSPQAGPSAETRQEAPSIGIFGQ